MTGTPALHEPSHSARSPGSRPVSPKHRGAGALQARGGRGLLLGSLILRGAPSCAHGHKASHSLWLAAEQRGWPHAPPTTETSPPKAAPLSGVLPTSQPVNASVRGRQVSREGRVALLRLRRRPETSPPPPPPGACTGLGVKPGSGLQAQAFGRGMRGTGIRRVVKWLPFSGVRGDEGRSGTES